MILHDVGCHARLSPQRASCSCGMDPDDTAPPLRCPVCEVPIARGSGWQHCVIVDSQAYIVVTCTAEFCKSQAEAACRVRLAFATPGAKP